MKYLIMCEGPNELEVIRILLRHGCLKFTADDLLGLVPYHARQIKSSGTVQAALDIYPGKVAVLRIGDKLNEKLLVPKEYQEKIISVEKYCTKPELEMLLIISEGLVKEFEKVKSKEKAKSFAKKNIRCGRRQYKNDTSFYTEYYGNNIGLLISSIKEYRHIKNSHSQDEHYLAELLK
ncbi:MAG: GNAT family acetyltransferase [Lachnospiraceae bacterium]|nr:GNAT family acetyltransferase [Lachnospiraceae bacterium]